MDRLDKVRAFMRALFVFPIKAYRLIHPYFFHGVCRFTPTCSAYAIEAIQTHGILKGSALAAYRVLRCNPFSRGGYDPVPPRKDKYEQEHSHWRPSDCHHHGMVDDHGAKTTGTDSSSAGSPEN